MNYLDLKQIKQQCRIDSWFTDDDEMLESIGDGAESFLENYLDTPLDDITAENGGELPKTLERALLMLCDYLYDASGSGDTKEIPKSFFMLALPYKKYSVA